MTAETGGEMKSCDIVGFKERLFNAFQPLFAAHSLHFV